MQYLREHRFRNGDLLVLNVASTYAGLHGLTVYTVFYGSKDNDAFQAIGSEPFMSQVEANEAFDKRVASSNPSQPTRQHSGIHGLVLDTFKRYLGELTFRREPLPTDWAGFSAHVMSQTIGRDNTYFDATKVNAALNGLTTTTSKDTDGRADVMVELPAWKILQMLTAITALAMAVRHSEQKSSRAAA